jgi:hypothetical protein
MTSLVRDETPAAIRLVIGCLLAVACGTIAYWAAMRGDRPTIGPFFAALSIVVLGFLALGVTRTRQRPHSDQTSPSDSSSHLRASC